MPTADRETAISKSDRDGPRPRTARPRPRSYLWEKVSLQKFHCGRIEHIWVSLWNFFLSSIGPAGIDIFEENSNYFEKVVFGKFFQFEKQLKNVFFVNTYVFRREYRSLWVCYRYGRWCVGNLGPNPFQTRYSKICIRCLCWRQRRFFENFSRFRMQFCISK